MKLHHKNLKSRGWSEHEIKKARAILKKADELKHPHSRALEHITYYLCLLVAAAGNFAVSAIMIPLLLAFPTPILYLITAIIGLCFGILFTVLLKDLVHLEAYHKFLYGIIPVIALINIAMAAEKYTGLRIVAGSTAYSPLILGLIYAAAFIFPYIYFLAEGEEWI